MALADNMPRDAVGDLKRQIRDLERAVREMRAERRLDSATISAEPGKGIRVADFNGTDFANPGTVGNYFGGDGAVLNALKLRPGSVSNDELANPVASAVAHDDAQGFAVTTSNVQILSATVPVPAGYSQALILNLAVAVTAYNNTAAVDFLYCKGYVNGVASGWQVGSMDVSSTGTGVGHDLSTGIVTGLSGGSITLTGKVSSAFGTWAADDVNVANLDASILFLR